MVYKLVFWILLGLVFYSYIGYGILLSILTIKTKSRKKSKFTNEQENEPEVTLFIAAYNEIDFIEKKIENSLNLDYPKEKLHLLFVTDGSNDGSEELARKYKQVTVLHENERNGKIGAINRGMSYITTPIVIFSDCNTMLSSNAVRVITETFRNPAIGCVAGEKRIKEHEKDSAVNAGEGIYWKYESWIKHKESAFNSAMGAVGELFAIRTALFRPVEKDTILDDFIISLRIAQQGYKIAYTPNAYGVEAASINVHEELKRKIRIASGGIQAMGRLKKLLNPFVNPTLTFQYISHKVLRWTLIPLSIPFIFLLNLYLFLYSKEMIYIIFFYGQILFYFFVILGYIFENKNTKAKFIFVPYYIYIMNYAVYAGFIRYIKGKQSANWERVKRGS